MDLQQAPPRLMTLRTGVGEPVHEFRYEGRDLSFELLSADPRIKDLGMVTQNPEDLSLEEAPFIMGAGNGINDWDTFNAVSKRLNATCAATRVVCDAGLMARDCQVGASGCLVQADCYLALGISGAIQHLQGIEQCARVVAINTDPYAPIVKRADFTIIGDANAILKAVLANLENSL